MTSARHSFFLMASLLLVSLHAKAEPIKLRINLQQPISSTPGVNLTEFKEEVERRTDKTVTIEIFEDSKLYKDHEIVGAVASGAIEMGTPNLDQYIEKIPAVAIFQQPFLFNFEALVRAATNPDHEFRKLIDKAVLETAATRVLWWQSYGSNVVFSKGRPTATPAAIVDQRIRVLGHTMANFTKHCGGSPFIIPASQQVEAIRTGQVDMAMTSANNVRSRQFWKVTDTLTRTDHAAIEHLVIINEGVWQRLSDDHKAIILEAARKVERTLRDQMQQIEKDAYRHAEEKGMTVYELTPDQVAEWRACSAPVLESFMTNAGDLATQLLKAYGKLRTEPCCSSGPPGAFTTR